MDFFAFSPPDHIFQDISYIKTSLELSGRSFKSVVDRARIYNARIQTGADVEEVPGWAGLVAPDSTALAPLRNYLLIYLDEYFLAAPPVYVGRVLSEREDFYYQYVSSIGGWEVVQLGTAVSSAEATGLRVALQPIANVPRNGSDLIIHSTPLFIDTDFPQDVLPYRVIAADAGNNAIIYGATFRTPASGSPFLSDYPTVPTTTTQFGNSFPPNQTYRCFGVTIPPGVDGANHIMLDGLIRIPRYLFDQSQVFSRGQNISAALYRRAGTTDNFTFMEYTNRGSAGNRTISWDSSSDTNWEYQLMRVGDMVHVEPGADAVYTVSIRDQRVVSLPA